MFAKVLILALALSANAQLISKSIYGSGIGLTGGLPLLRSHTLGNLGYAGYGKSIIGAYGVPAVSKVAVNGLGLGYAGLGLAGAYGANLGLANLNIARGINVHAAGPVHAAVQTLSRTVDYTPVPYSGEPAVVQDVDVPPQEMPLRINFQSRSSPLQVTQGHIPAEPAQVQVTQSEDEPQTAIHNVHRPVIQQVNEVVQPYRTLSQVVNPVVENTHTNIHQGDGIAGVTGLSTGVVGGNLVGAGLGYAGLGAYGLGLRKAGLGYGLAGVGGLRTLGLANTGLYGGRVLSSGLYGNGLLKTGLYGTGLGLGLGVTDLGLATKIARF